MAWAYIFHQKILFEVQKTDGRKVHKTSRLGLVLAAMFNRVQNLKTLYGKGYAVKIQPYTRGVKRFVETIEDEPPPLKTQAIEHQSQGTSN